MGIITATRRNRETGQVLTRRVWVDDADVGWLSLWKWGWDAQGYIYRKQGARGKVRQIFMHRYLLDVPAGMVIDHINHNLADCRRFNLRICTHAENMRNQKPRQGGASQYKGVVWHRVSRKWHAGVKYNYKHISLGYFTNEADAAKAYNMKAQELFGTFARLNIITPVGETMPMFG